MWEEGRIGNSRRRQCLRELKGLKVRQVGLGGGGRCGEFLAQRTAQPKPRRCEDSKEGI